MAGTILKHLVETDFAINARVKGAKGDGVTDDTAALMDAKAAAGASSGAPGLWIPMGLYVFDGEEMDLLTDDMVFASDGAAILFKTSAVWKVGDPTPLTGHMTGRMKFRGLRFVVDASSTVAAPLQLACQNGTAFTDCVIDQIKAAGILHQYGVCWMRNTDSRMMPGAGQSVVKLAPGNGDTVAIFTHAGRHGSGEHTGQVFIDFEGTGTGRVDGIIMTGVNTADLDGVLKARPDVGGQIGDVAISGCFFDQVDQAAFDFVMPAGSILGDISIGGKTKLNANGNSSKTSAGVGAAHADAIIKLDLTSGATHQAGAVFSVTDCVFQGARARNFECLGGAFSSLIFSRNVMMDHGRQAAAVSRGAYFAGTFDYLEEAGNHYCTTNTHDFDVEFAAVTATRAKVEGSTSSATAPNTSAYNSYALHSGEFGQVDFHVSAGALTQDRTSIKGATAARTAAGTFTITYPSATPYKGVQAVATADGCYCSITRTSATVFTLKTYGEGGTTLTDPTNVSFGLKRAA